jgi:hypothetical protein
MMEPWLAERRARLLLILGPGGETAFDLAVKTGMADGSASVGPNSAFVAEHLDHLIALAEAGCAMPTDEQSFQASVDLARRGLASYPRSMDGDWSPAGLAEALETLAAMGGKR